MNEMIICKAKAEGRCKGSTTDARHCNPHSESNVACEIDECYLKRDLISNVACIPYHPKEVPMEYEIVRPISIKALIQAASTREIECEEFWKELNSFGGHLIKIGSIVTMTCVYGDVLVLPYLKDHPRAAEWLKEKGFIKVKEIPLKVGDKVTVIDSSWSWQVEDEKLQCPDGSLVKDSPMKVVAICEGLPTRPSCSDTEVTDNNLILRGQSGSIYFSRKQFVKRV